jgi:hypothetical protein
VRSALRDLTEELRTFSEGADELHFHAPSRSHVRLPPDLQLTHEKAEDATHLADHVARDWPERQRKMLHAKAVDHHLYAADALNQDGFEQLAGQHFERASYHAAHANAGAPVNLRLHSPLTGTAQSGHRLPAEPTNPSASWNAQYNSYIEIPPEIGDDAQKAAQLTHDAHELHNDKKADVEKKHAAHMKALRHHVRVAADLHRHGFHPQAAEHDDVAKAHLLAVRALRK